MIVSYNDRSNTALIRIDELFKEEAPNLYELLRTKHEILSFTITKQHMKLMRGNDIAYIYPNSRASLMPAAVGLAVDLANHVNTTCHLIEEVESEEVFWLSDELKIDNFKVGEYMLVDVKATDVLDGLMVGIKQKKRRVEVPINTNFELVEVQPATKSYDSFVTVMYAGIVSLVIVLVYINVT